QRPPGTHRRDRVRAPAARREARRRRVPVSRRGAALGQRPGKGEGGRGGRGAGAARRARHPPRAGVRPSRGAGPHALGHVAPAGALRPPVDRRSAVMLGSTALLLSGALVALGAALWAGLLALAEEAAVGEALHTLGDAPPQTVGGRVPLHRALHVSRLALLVLGAVGASRALGWWQQPWERSLLELAAAVGLLFVVGDALPRSIARLAPELSTAALPLARRTLVPFGPLLWLLAWVDRGLHALVAIPRPLQPDLGAARRGPLAGPGASGALRAGDEDSRQPAPRVPARAGPSRDRRRRVRRHLGADHPGGHPRGDRRRDPRRARRGSSGRDPPRRQPLCRGRAGQPQRPLAGLGAVLRAPRYLDRRRVDL